LDHLEDSKHKTNNQQHLKNKKASEEQHHLEYPLHPGIKIFFLVYVILVTISVKKMQIVEPMQRTKANMKAIQTTVISKSHTKHNTKIITISVH
jgi:hypothetical protein